MAVSQNHWKKYIAGGLFTRTQTASREIWSYIPYGYRSRLLWTCPEFLF